MLMAGDWTNPCAAHDVSGDGQISAIDALLPINELARVGGTVELDSERPGDTPYYDADGNDLLSPLDALVVINSLDRINAIQSGNSDSVAGRFDFDLQLSHDSAPDGETNTDGLTNDATISGNIGATLGIGSLTARVDNRAPVSVTHQCGAFLFDPDLAADGSEDGAHTIQFTVTNEYGTGSQSVSLMLDTVASELDVRIAADDDTGLPGDRVTSRSAISLQGTAAAFDTVQRMDTGEQVIADDDGQFQFDNIGLLWGENTIQLRSFDAAGNETQIDAVIVGTPGDFEEDQSIGLIKSESLPSGSGVVPALDVDEPTLPLVTSDDESVQYVATLLNQDFATDLVTLSSASDELVVYLGTENGMLGTPARYASGSTAPTAIWVGDFIGDPLPDVVIGHASGELTFLEGVEHESLRPRPDLTISGLGQISDLTAADFDQDGDLDLIVSGKDRMTWLDNDDDPLPFSPIFNGEFTSNLIGWTTEFAGAPVNGIDGTVRTNQGHVQLIENDSFLVSLRQDFTIPHQPESISFDLLEINLGRTDGRIPDVFEVSLYDESGQSLVAPISPESTSLLNTGPDGDFRTADAVSISGTVVTIDISSITPETAATLQFDLVGNESEILSTVSLSNVQIVPNAIRKESFSSVELEGPFENLSGVGYSDINGDGWTDVVVEDEASNPFIVFYGNPNGGFDRQGSASIQSAGESAGAGNQITIGQQVSGSLSALGEIDRFTFTALAGQRLFFDAQDTTGLQTWALTDPSGSDVFREGMVDLDGIAITQSGTYELSISGFLQSTGPYQFQIHEIPDTTVETINVDELIQRELNVPGQELEYQIELSAGDTYYFDVLSVNPTLTWSLTAPDETGVFDDAMTDQGSIEPTQTGSYRLLIDGESDATGVFQFQIHDVPNSPPTEILFDTEIDSEIMTPGESDRYTFNATSDQKIYIDTHSGSHPDLQLTLTNPSNELVLTDSFLDQDPLILSLPGTYTLEISGAGDTTGHYQFTVWNVPNDAPRPIDYNTPVTGALTIPTETQLYELEGQAGDEIAFHEIYDAGTSLRYSLIGPSGQLLFEDVDSDQSVTLTESGIHTLLVAGQHDNIGVYSFQFGRDGVAPPSHASANLVVDGVLAPEKSNNDSATFDVSWQVRNDGDVSVPAGTPITHHVHFSSDHKLDALDLDPRIHVVTMLLESPLDPGESITVSDTVPLPIGIEGELYVIVNIDAENNVFEDQAEVSDNAGSARTILESGPRELQGNTTIDLSVTDGSEFPAGTVLSLSGNVATTPGAVNAVFLLDLSGSTRLMSGLDADFDGVVDDSDDLNGDGSVGDLLDREIGLTLETIRRLAESNTDVRVSVVAWTGSSIAFPSGGEVLDVGESRFNQLFVDPTLPNVQAELETAVRSLSYRLQGLATHSGASQFREFIIGPGNNYDESLTTLLDVLDSAPEADQTQVYFFTDGLFVPNEDLGALPETIDEVAARGIQFRAIQAVGPAQVNETCSADVSPDWCNNVDPGVDFVDVVEQIRDGIDAVDGSAADIVIGDSPDALDDLILPPVHIAGVTINGVATDSFDVAGNFFETIEIAEGDNTYVVRAIDSLGNQSERQITLIGTERLDYEDLSEITGLTEAVFDTASWNRNSRVLSTSARIENRSTHSLRGPFHLLIDRIEPSTISLTSPHQQDPNGKPVITLTDPLSNGGLMPWESSLAVDLQFDNAESERFSIEYTILTDGNETPAIDSSPPHEAGVGRPYRYDVVASDRDGDPLKYDIIQAPTGLTIDPVTGEVLWTPSTEQIGTHQVDLRAQDDWGGSTRQVFQIDVSETIANRPPIIQSSPVTQIATDDTYHYFVAATDPDGDDVQFTLVDAPAGMTIDSVTGEIQWASTNDGVHAVSLEVFDGESVSSQSFVLTVGDTSVNPSSPLILSTPTLIAAVGQTYIYVPFAQDQDGDALTFSALTSPTGLTIDSDSGTMEWSPTSDQIGFHTLTLRVDDGRGGVSTQLFTVEVQSEVANLPPSFVSTPLAIATVDELYQYVSESLDLNDDDLQYDVLRGPQGLIIDPLNGMVQFQPTADQLGTHRIELQVTDGNASGFQTFDLEVRGGPNVPPTFTSTPKLESTVGQPYYYAAAANDQDDQFQFSLLSGPEGFAIDEDTGLVAFAPAVEQLGAHEVTLVATDDRGASSSQTYWLEVVADTVPPVASISLSTSVALPDETVEIQVTSVDNVAVEFVSLSLDGDSISLDELGRGTFVSSAPGLFELTATAVDDSGNTGTTVTKLRVVDPDDSTPPLLIVDSPEPGQQVSYLTDIIGSVVADDLEFYRIEYAPADEIDLDHFADPNPAWIPLTESTSGGTDFEMGTFDPTVLNDGGYLLRLTAQDFSGNADVQVIPFDVNAPAKLGHFSLDFTDLSIPLPGLPIEVTRRYSTLEAGTQGDFGYGWSLGLGDPNLRETVASDSTNTVGVFGASPFVFGTRVYLTNPDGDRIGFTFEPERTSSFFGTAYTPKFIPDPGVTDALSVDEITLSQNNDGTFAAFLIGFPFNPDQYKLTRPDGTVYEYDQTDGLKSVIDPSGNQLQITRDGIEHSSGESIVFHRDSLGRITEIVDPDGNSMTYQYSASGELIKVIDQAGVSTEYRYLADSVGYLNEVIGDSGQLTQRTEYDDDGRIAAIIDGNGNRREQTWDPASFTGTFIDGNENVTQLVYDSRGNILQEIDALGNATLYEYGDSRHPDFETKVTDRRGFVVERTYDDAGSLLTYAEIGHQDSPFQNPIITSYAYNELGLPIKVTDALQNETTFRYDDAGNVLEIINALGDSSHFTYDALGRLTSSVDYNSNTITFEYGQIELPTKVTYADGSFDSLVYNSFGQPTELEIFESNGSLVERHQAEYDPAGRIVRTVTGSGTETNAANFESRWFYSGDALDFQAFVSPLSLDSSGAFQETPATPIDQRDSLIADILLDAEGRILEKVAANGSTTTYRYDGNGNQILLQDPVGNITTWVYDSVNRVSEMRDPLFNDGMTIEQAIEALETPSGADCENGTGAQHIVTHCYDAEGNLTQSIDRNGRRTEFAYDHVGRQLEERWFDLSGDLISTSSFTYDVVGNMLSASNPDSLYAYDYDVLNRVIREQVNPDGSRETPQLTFDFEYDAEGNRVRSTDSLGGVIESEYDERNRLSVRQWTGSQIDDARFEFVHNAADRLAEVLRFDDAHGDDLVAKSEYSYNLAGRETRLQHFDALDQVLTDYDYEYDAFSRLSSESHHGETIAYSYDPAGQLLSAIKSGLEDERFGYDANGNRTETGQVIGTGNQLLSDSDFTYEYDGEGNLVSRTDRLSGETTQFIYDHDNRLTEITVVDADGNVVSETTFTYDALGRRIARAINGETTFTIYDGDNAYADFDAAGNVITRYLFADRMDQAIARQRDGENLAWYLSDRQGTIHDIIDATGTIIAHADYGAFGNMTGTTNGAAFDLFTYTGRESIEGVDLMYYRARIYDPVGGQFLSQDPLGFDAGDENLYRYVFNSPQNATDPTGEFSVVDYGLIVILGAEVGVILGGVATVVLFGPITALAYYMSTIIEDQQATIKEQRELIEEICDKSPNCRLK